uniref:Col_cuticle_N domain-containing protein n=1 Tax=Angiostrongylus cantonensis TaxID=6313 RepID=A0A0K0DEX8_ANGCA
MKKRKHTFCSWTFGIVAIVVMTVIIVLQTKADFS